MVHVGAARSGVAHPRGRPVFGFRDRLLFGACVLVNAGALVWFAGQVLAFNGSVRLLPALAPFAIGLVGFETRWFSLPLMRRPVPVAPPPGLRVAAVTSFVPGAESVEMLARTLRAMVAMEYPHDTWVLDEGDDPEIVELCDDLGAKHFSRRSITRYQQPAGPFAAATKHGNYNAWLDAVAYESYDVIAAFDPDHIPRPEFLVRTLGHLADERVGYVQAAQVYYNQPVSFVARGAAEETYAYYSSIQMTTHALGYPILTGCHNVNRVAALKEIGGFAAHDADDLLTTVMYRAAGWEGVYVPEVLAAGLTPVDWSSYLNQQRRWARSVLDVKLRVLPRVVARLPITERVVAALHGLYYLHGLATAAAVATLASSLALGWGPRRIPGGLLASAAAVVATMVSCDFFRQRFFVGGRAERGLHLRSGVLKFAKWPWVLLALVDAVSGRRFAFAITPKTGTAARTKTLLRGHAAPFLLVAAGWAVGASLGRAPTGPMATAASVYLAVTAAVIAGGGGQSPPAYDDDVAEERVPWSRALCGKKAA